VPRENVVVTGQDKRAEGRAHVFLTATIYDARGSEPVRIRNLSARGALVEGIRLPATGSFVRLVRGALLAAGRVAWNGTKVVGINFDKPVDADAWIRPVHHAGQQRVDEIVAAMRLNEPVPPELESDIGSSLSTISAALDELCGRLADLPDSSLALGEELVKLDAIAHSLRLATGRTH
jgi:hypothetical protein